jgi:predicted HTH domain antitoxin
MFKGNAAVVIIVAIKAKVRRKERIMEVSVKVAIPDDVLSGQNGEISHRILEEFALEGFKSGQLTIAQVRRILGLETRIQAHEFLAAHGVPWVDYDEAELQRELENLKELVP